jgi:hypothetical protein
MQRSLSVALAVLLQCKKHLQLATGLHPDDGGRNQYVLIRNRHERRRSSMHAACCWYRDLALGTNPLTLLMKLRFIALLLFLLGALGSFSQQSTLDSFVPTIVRFHGTIPASTPCLKYQVAVNEVGGSVSCAAAGLWQSNRPTRTISTGSAGQAAVMKLADTAYAPQDLPVIDARKFGVSCNGSTDDTANIQAALTAACNTGSQGKALVLPNSCKIKLTSTLVASKCSGMSFYTFSPQGQATIPGGNASLLWYGVAGGTVLEINQTRESNFGPFTIDTEASNHGAVGANVGLLIDEIAPVINIVTNNHFDNIQVYNPFANPNFLAVSVCPTAPGNCEAQNFDRLMLTCSGSTPTVNSAGTGFALQGGQPNYQYIHWLYMKGCSTAISTGNQVVDIDGGLMQSNYTDLKVNAGIATTYKNIVSQESVSQIVLVGSVASITIEHDIFDGLTNGTTTISYTGSPGNVTLRDNYWNNPNNTVTPFGPSGGGSFPGRLISENNVYPGSICPVVTNAALWVSIGDFCTSPPFNSAFAVGGGSGLPSTSNGQIVDYHNGFRSVPQTVGNTFTCSAAFEGSIQAISDSRTNTPGATITGGGSKHVLGYCDGTNFVVMAP